jgi:hypothetical protein
MNKSGTRTVNPRVERNKLCSNEADWSLNGGGYAIDITSQMHVVAMDKGKMHARSGLAIQIASPRLSPKKKRKKKKKLKLL